ncbi:hypothetical protein ACROYT_G028722 [Oculina patagonica]
MPTRDAEEGVNMANGNNFNVEIHAGGTIAIGNGNNQYTRDPANQDHIYDFSPEGSSSNPISSDTFPFESDRRESQCRSARRGVSFQEKSQGQERTERESVYYCFQNDALTCLPADIQQPLWQNLNPKPGKDTFVDTGKDVGNTIHIIANQCRGPIAIGDITNLGTSSPDLVVRDPADPNHIYDDLHKVNERRRGEQRDERENGYVCLDPGKGRFNATGFAGNPKLSVGLFLENVEKSIKEFDDTAGPRWEEKEQFIVQVVLSTLKKSWRKSCSSRLVVYNALAKISCSRSSSKVVSYALRMLHRLMQCESGKDSLLGVEKIVRLSINSTDAVFKEEGYLERELRLCAYSDILALLIFQQTQGRLFAVDIKKELSELQKFLKKYKEKKRDYFQYYMKFIQEAISHLLKSTKKMQQTCCNKSQQHGTKSAFLNECQGNIATQVEECKLKNPKSIREMSKGNWLALHCGILHLKRKVHCSETDEMAREAVLLLLSVMDTYKEGVSGNDWKFCLLAASVYSDIAMKNVNRESRIAGVNCLVTLLKDKQGMQDLQETIHNKLQGSFGNGTSYWITEEKDGSVVRETIVSGDKLHGRRLLRLNHPNLCINLTIELIFEPFRVIEVISVATHLGNLKEYVLNGHCQESTIVAFLSQVASALHHLHKRHIVHGDLRAEHVNVVEPNQVQIVRLGRSKSLVMRPGENTSKSCMVQADMPPESTRWSAPEVILQGLYSHASDVWSFGVVAWELNAAFTNGVNYREQTLPYFDLSDNEILPNIQNSKLLCKPKSCPEWIYIMIHQCWPYQPRQRPPVIALYDRLTSRKPTQSRLMKLLDHKEEE